MDDPITPPERAERTRQGQFRKGASGNPKGRPPGAKSLKTVVQEAARRMIPMTIDGRRRHVSAIEALMTSLLQAGLKGDRHARQDFLRYFERFAPDELETLAKATLSEAEEELLATLLGRTTSPNQEEADDLFSRLA